MKNNAQISLLTLVNASAAAALIAMLALSATFVSQLGKLKINGQIYAEILSSKDLVADILPPPAFIIESYLAASLLIGTEDRVRQNGLSADLRRLEEKYHQRIEFWRTRAHLDPSALMMTREPFDHARKFFAAVNERLVPAIENGDTAGAKAAFNEAALYFEAHRQAIERTVAEANWHAESIEEAAAKTETMGFIAIGFVLVATAAAMVALFLGIRRMVVGPITTLAGGLERLATGDEAIQIPQSPYIHEIDHLSAAAGALRDVVVRAFRQGQILEQMDAQVMMAEGNDLTITYMNRASRVMLERIREHLPYAPDEILGQSVDIFHAHPAGPRKVLSDPSRLPHQSRIKVGNEVLDLRVSPVFKRDGSYAGPLLTWDLVTERSRLEVTINTVVQSLSGTTHQIGAAASTLSATQIRTRREPRRRKSSGRHCKCV